MTKEEIRLTTQKLCLRYLKERDLNGFFLKRCWNGETDRHHGLKVFKECSSRDWVLTFGFELSRLPKKCTFYCNFNKIQNNWWNLIDEIRLNKKRKNKKTFLKILQECTRN